MKNDERKILVYASWLEKENLIGTLYCNTSRGNQIYSFEYSKNWLENFSNISLDPDLYNTVGRQFVPQDKKIFGLFSDCAPDRWGRTLLKRKEEILATLEKRAPNQLYEIDYLLGVNDESRMGGLRFKYENCNNFLSTEDSLCVPPFESLRKLEQASINFEKSKNPLEEKWLKIILQPGSSLGGARPKATVKAQDGSLWIAKFPSNDDDYNTGAWEQTVNQLAYLCGLNVPETDIKIFTKKGATFLSKRFDRIIENGITKRIHYASAMTLLGKTDGASSSEGISYLDIAEFIKSNSIQPEKDLEELWKRVLFNVLISNTDDHLRNHGFLLDKNGWKLSPLFDINPNPSGKFLTLNITENNNTKNLELVLKTAKYYNLSDSKAKDEIKKFIHLIKNNWNTFAKNNNISQKEIEARSFDILELK